MSSLRIALTGATGMLGTALTPVLAAAGHSVVPVSRHALPGGMVWDPLDGKFDATLLDDIDAVIHLAGESLADGRWTADRKTVLRQSRTASTRLLATAMASRPRPPRVLICASAMGFYGDRGDEVVDEQSGGGNGFLADLVREWEASADPARAASIRVVHTRFGVILSRTGGALGKMVGPFKLGLGGPFGDGKQWLSWVAIADVLQVLAQAVEDDRMAGPINLTSPNPARNADFAAALGHELGRPAVVPIPAFALRLALGEMADEALLFSTRVRPARLLDLGYRFAYPDLPAALHAVLANP